MVPAILVVLLSMGFGESVAVHMAIGTSLSVIAVTGVSSAYGHWRVSAVDKEVLRVQLFGLLLGAVLGGIFASEIPGESLRVVFGVFVMFAGIRMSTNVGRAFQIPRPANIGLLVSGSVIGFVSAVFGVGGGILSVPWFQSIGLKMHKAIGTSAACGVPIAVAGAFTFGVTGQAADIESIYAIGFIYWPAFLTISALSVPFARLGAMLAHRVSQKDLKRIFGALLVMVGVYLISQ